MIESIKDQLRANSSMGYIKHPHARGHGNTHTFSLAGVLARLVKNLVTARVSTIGIDALQ
jgi:hypothetical protein